MVKVEWYGQTEEEFTWEVEEAMMKEYPELFNIEDDVDSYVGEELWPS